MESENYRDTVLQIPVLDDFGIHKGNTFKNNRKNEFGRQRIMKSVRTKLIASILICSLFTSVLIGVIAISNSVRTAGKDAMTMMQLTGQKKTEEINSTIQKIEQSVDTLSEVAMSNFDYDSFRQSKDYADTYTETVQQAVLDFANHTNGAVTVYLRYNPDYSNPTSGVFAQRQSVDSELQCLTPTDFPCMMKAMWSMSAGITFRYRQRKLSGCHRT